MKDERRKPTKSEKDAIRERVGVLGVGEITRRPNCTVIIQARDTETDIEYTGVGWAKVMNPDQWIPQRGFDIAYGKAVQHIIEQILNVRGADRFTVILGGVVEEPIPF